jgi:uncharacterized protein YjbI with pentapeptide repeats
MASKDPDRYALGGDLRLSDVERRIVRAAIAGEAVDIAKAAPDRRLRAEVIRRLFLHGPADGRVSVLGVDVAGADIDGALDLAGFAAPGGGFLPPLSLRGCRFAQPPCLNGARLDGVRLDGSCFPGLSGKALAIARGFSAENAVCDGDLDLSDAHVGGDVNLEGLRDHTLAGDWPPAPRVTLNAAIVGGTVKLSGARLASPTHDPALDLVGADLRHLELEHANVLGGLDATAVKIAIQFNATAARFAVGDAKDGVINLAGADLGSLSLNKAIVTGQLGAIGAAVKGRWSADNAQFAADQGLALTLDSLEAATVSLVRARVIGGLRARNATIHGRFDAKGARFENPGGEALNLYASEIVGGLSLQDHRRDPSGPTPIAPVEIIGQLDLTQTKLGGDLSMDGARVTAPSFGQAAGVAVDARELRVTGSLWWCQSVVGNSPSVKGAVNLGGATVGGDVDLTGLTARHKTPGLVATTLDRRGTFTRLGLSGVAVSMVGIDIGGSLKMTDGGATTIKGCFNLSRATIKRDVWLEAVRLRAAAPGRDGKIVPASEAWRHAVALSLYGAAVGKALRIGRLSPDRDPLRAGVVDLRAARCAELDDGRCGDGWGRLDPDVDANGRPRGYRLALDGFVYDHIEDPDADQGNNKPWRWLNLVPDWVRRRSSFLDHLPLWARRERWLRRQFRGRARLRDDYSPQPWGQLAEAFRRAGRDDDARHIAVAHANFRLEAGVEPFLTSLTSWMLRIFVNFGYAPLRGLLWLCLFVVLAAFAAERLRAADLAPGGAPHGKIFVVTAKDSGNIGQPCAATVDPPLYAVDVFLPVINLKEQDRCDISPARPLLRRLKAAYAIFGWIFTSLAALAFTGVLQRR